MKCGVCHRKSESIVCQRCWDNAMTQVHTFPAKYHELENELLPTRGYGERVQGTKTPPIPVQLETLYLRSGGISKPLTNHEITIRAMQSHTRVTFRGEEENRVAQTCTYIHTHSEWIFKSYPAADDLAVSIKEIAGKINHVLGFRSDEISIGTCPTLDDDGQVCGAILRINPSSFNNQTVIKCRVCDTTWDNKQWRFLGRVLEG